MANFFGRMVNPNPTDSATKRVIQIANTNFTIETIQSHSRMDRHIPDPQGASVKYAHIEIPKDANSFIHALNVFFKHYNLPTKSPQELRLLAVNKQKEMLHELNSKIDLSDPFARVSNWKFLENVLENPNKYDPSTVAESQRLHDAHLILAEAELSFAADNSKKILELVNLKATTADVGRSNAIQTQIDRLRTEKFNSEQYFAELLKDTTPLTLHETGIIANALGISINLEHTSTRELIGVDGKGSKNDKYNLFVTDDGFFQPMIKVDNSVRENNSNLEVTLVDKGGLEPLLKEKSSIFSKIHHVFQRAFSYLGRMGGPSLFPITANSEHARNLSLAFQGLLSSPVFQRELDKRASSEDASRTELLLKELEDKINVGEDPSSLLTTLEYGCGSMLGTFDKIIRALNGQFSFSGSNEPHSVYTVDSDKTIQKAINDNSDTIVTSKSPIIIVDYRGNLTSDDFTVNFDKTSSEKYKLVGIATDNEVFALRGGQCCRFANGVAAVIPFDDAAALDDSGATDKQRRYLIYERMEKGSRNTDNTWYSPLLTQSRP